MKEIGLWIAVLFLPSLAMAQSQTYFDTGRKVEDLTKEIIDSPIYGVLGYSFLAMGVFFAIVLVIIVLVMLLKRH